MAKLRELDMENEEELCDVAKALSSPIRIKIIKLLYQKGMIIGEIAKQLNIPPSSAAMHVKILEKAELIRLEEQPGTRGSMKLCTRKPDYLSISLLSRNRNINEIASVELPVGAFSSCKVMPTCGLFSLNGSIGMEDTLNSFYLRERLEAQLFWTSAGYVTYRFANTVPRKQIPKRISLSMEICSEAPNYRENWKSDITVWMNGVDCGTWTSPGDFGSRRGRLNPSSWLDGGTQYGLLMTWEVRQDGAYINEEKKGDVRTEDLEIMDKPYIEVKIGNKEDAKYVGGFNLFGKGFGDYAQDLILSIEY